MSKPAWLTWPLQRMVLTARRAAILALVVAVCALVPWSIRSQHTEVNPDDPSQILKQIQAAGPAGSENETPTDQSVRDLAATVRGVPGYDLPVSAREIASVKTVPGPYRKLGRIKIPSIGLDTQYGEGVFAKTLDHGPGHWPGTPMPGREGNSVLSGHRNTHTQPFKQLDELRPGNKIIVSVGKGRPVTYSVTKTTIVREAQFKDFVLVQPDGNGARQITLFACHPEGNPVFRIVVRATATSFSS